MVLVKSFFFCYIKINENTTKSNLNKINSYKKNLKKSKNQANPHAKLSQQPDLPTRPSRPTKPHKQSHREEIIPPSINQIHLTPWEIKSIPSQQSQVLLDIKQTKSNR